MIGAGNSVEAFAAALATEIKRNRPRPFAAFRGDYRRPLSNRAKIKGAPRAADLRRVYAMSIQPDRASNIAKLQRGLRIIARCTEAAT